MISELLIKALDILDFDRKHNVNVVLDLLSNKNIFYTGLSSDQNNVFMFGKYNPNVIVRFGNRDQDCIVTTMNGDLLFAFDDSEAVSIRDFISQRAKHNDF